MFTGQLYEEIKQLQEDVEAVHDKIDDPVICEKVRLFVESPKEFQEIFQADAGKRRLISLFLSRYSTTGIFNSRRKEELADHYFTLA